MESLAPVLTTAIEQQDPLWASAWTLQQYSIPSSTGSTSLSDSTSTRMRKSALFWMRLLTCLPCDPAGKQSPSLRVMQVPSHTRSFWVPATSCLSVESDTQTRVESPGCATVAEEIARRTALAGTGPARISNAAASGRSRRGTRVDRILFLSHARSSHASRSAPFGRRRRLAPPPATE
ncbi:MAG: hypothetical protein U0802_02600 [Candidatus Binatia bacterium]